MDGKIFIKQAQDIFAFLIDNGFTLVRAEPDKTGYRWEDVLEYRSDKLMFLVQRSSESDGVWSIVGRPNKHYPDGAVGLTELLRKIGISRTKFSGDQDSIQQAQEEASLWKAHFLPLLQGDIHLLQEIWSERKSTESKLLKHQRAVALKTEVIGRTEIIELPNTADALGKDYLARFPSHNFSNGKIWMVITPKEKMFCQCYDLALNCARSYKET